VTSCETFFGTECSNRTDGCTNGSLQRCAIRSFAAAGVEDNDVSQQHVMVSTCSLLVLYSYLHCVFVSYSTFSPWCLTSVLHVCRHSCSSAVVCWCCRLSVIAYVVKRYTADIANLSTRSHQMFCKLSSRYVADCVVSHHAVLSVCLFCDITLHYIRVI